MDYRPRLIETRIQDYLQAFGAVVITGPKWCGKTTTAERFSKSSIFMQDMRDGDRYRQIAQLNPGLLLEGETPRLIDEWQEEPRFWDAIRFDVDRKGEPGQFLLTGSTVVDRSKIMHDGSGRFGEIRMRTMTLFEYGESTGEVSISQLFDGKSQISGISKHELEDVCRLIVRGGWPSSMGKSDLLATNQVEGYCESIVKYGISRVDGKKRDSKKAIAILRSLSRNISSEASASTLRADIEANQGEAIHENTIRGYLSALDALFVTDDVSAWRPKLRSKEVLRTSDVRYIADPAIAACFLGAGAVDLLHDPDTLGRLFMSMAVRDLRVYAESMRGRLYHYRDKSGLEADAVIHLNDGRWAAFEIKLNPDSADAGASALSKLRDKVDEIYSDKLSFLAVITSTGYAYTRSDGIHVIPLGCLRARCRAAERPAESGTHGAGTGARAPGSGFCRFAPVIAQTI